VFTHYCLNKYFNWGWTARYNNAITVAGCLLAILALSLYSDKIYTVFTAMALFLTLVVMNRVVKYCGQGQLTLAYVLLMPGFIAVNGVLTGTGLDSPVVNYNPSAITGYRILTIPLEDVAYGYVLVLLNIMLFNAIRGKKTLTIAVHKP
jgi:lycopene cyclase domain-containing protein